MSPDEAIYHEEYRGCKIEIHRREESLEWLSEELNLDYDYILVLSGGGLMPFALHGLGKGELERNIQLARLAVDSNLMFCR